MNEMKFCKDCKYVVMDSGKPKYWMCSHPSAPENRRQIPLNGKLGIRAYCDYARAREWECGPTAKWFEPMPTFIRLEEKPEPTNIIIRAIRWLGLRKDS